MGCLESNIFKLLSNVVVVVTLWRGSYFEILIYDTSNSIIYVVIEYVGKLNYDTSNSIALIEVFLGQEAWVIGIMVRKFAHRPYYT